MSPKWFSRVVAEVPAFRRMLIEPDQPLRVWMATVWEDKRIGKQVDSKSIALHRVAGSSPVSSAFLAHSVVLFEMSLW